jgi:hypothetical protein
MARLGAPLSVIQSPPTAPVCPPPPTGATGVVRRSPVRPAPLRPHVVTPDQSLRINLVLWALAAAGVASILSAIW